MSDEPGLNSTNSPRHGENNGAASEGVNLENYSIPDYLIEDDAEEADLFASEAAAPPQTNFFLPRPTLDRGFAATPYTQSAQPLNQVPYSTPESFSRPAQTSIDSRVDASARGLAKSPSTAPAKRSIKSRLTFWRKPQLPATSSQNQPPLDPQSLVPYAPLPSAVPTVDPQTGLETVGLPAPVVTPPRLWKKQPYRAIAHLIAILLTLNAAWLLGILVARIVPGSIERPPLQESLLRKSSRLASSLWHLPQLWQTPTAETRIEAIPLPETGPILQPVELTPIERQPLVDELNAVDTELLTLDRRIQTLEKQLGKPPYQNADLENRINALRAAVDPPVRKKSAPNQYEPSVKSSQAALLDVAKLKITLPSDALFLPGDSSLKASDLLNQVLDQLVSHPDATVVIRSYSDDQAKAVASRKYTLDQAIALSEYFSQSLSQIDQPNYRWVTIGGGQSQPVASNDTEPGRQRNRRIEILVDTR